MVGFTDHVEVTEGIEVACQVTGTLIGLKNVRQFRVGQPQVPEGLGKRSSRSYPVALERPADSTGQLNEAMKRATKSIGCRLKSAQRCKSGSCDFTLRRKSAASPD